MKQHEDPGQPQAQPTPRKRELAAPTDPAAKSIIGPRALPRCPVEPTPERWRERDLLAEIQAMARRGSIAVHPVGEALPEFSGFCDFPAGWIACGFRVPGGEKIHIRLTHPNQGWFRLIMVNKWGDLESGMLQNLIPTGDPEATYTNPTSEARNVYVIVDDPGWMSSEGNPFLLKITRSWDPIRKSVEGTSLVTGIWAERPEAPKRGSASAKGSQPSEG